LIGSRALTAHTGVSVRPSRPRSTMACTGWSSPPAEGVRQPMVVWVLSANSDPSSWRAGPTDPGWRRRAHHLPSRSPLRDPPQPVGGVTILSHSAAGQQRRRPDVINARRKIYL